MRRLLLVLVVLVGTLAGAAGRAEACSCAGSSDVDAFARADVVFRGDLVDYEPPPQRPVMSSTDPATWTFAVDEVRKGEAFETQPVVSEVGGGSCGLELPHDGGTFYVFAEHHGRYALYAGLCGGTRSADVPLAIGTPSPPTPPTERSTGWTAYAVTGVVIAGIAVLALLRTRNGESP